MSSKDDVPSWGIPLMDAYESDPEPAKAQPLPTSVSPTALSPDYSMDSKPVEEDPEEDPEKEPWVVVPATPSPPLLLSPPTRRDTIFKADMPPRKRARFATPSQRFETRGEVKESVTAIATKHRQDSEDFYVRHLDVQDDIDEATYADRLGLTLWIASKTLMKMMTKNYCPRSEIKKLETELWNLIVKEKYTGEIPDSIQGSVMASKPKILQEAIELTRSLMGQKLPTYDARQAENKRKMDNNSRKNHAQQPPYKKTNMARAYIVGPGEKRQYDRTLPLNAVGNGEARGKAYALREGEPNADSNVVTGTFLLNNRYASILFDTDVDIGFVLTTFSSLIDITPSTLDNSYDIELADERITGVNTLFRGYTLNLLNHPINIDLIPVELGSFDDIIGIDWLSKYHAVIIYDEKIVYIPYGDEVLIVQGDKSDGRSESGLNIISCAKTQKYLLKGCHVFLIHITKKKTEDTSEEERSEDVPVMRDFLEVFPKDLSGVPPPHQLEIQINLVPGAAHVAWAPYRLATSEMKKLSDQ
nr:putative reverse transcriptase domain-containing protein [Tanacetum cinerariifolium]